MSLQLKYRPNEPELLHRNATLVFIELHYDMVVWFMVCGIYNERSLVASDIHFLITLETIRWSFF